MCKTPEQKAAAPAGLVLRCAECGETRRFESTARGINAATDDILAQIDNSGWQDAPRPEWVKCPACAGAADESQMGYAD